MTSIMAKTRSRTIKDKRYRRTEHAIHNMLNEAIGKRRMNLKVREICTGAKITAPAFYTHYANSDEALLKYEEKMCGELTSLLQKTERKDAIFMTMLRFVKNHKSYFAAVVNGRNSWLLVEAFRAIRRQLGRGIRSDRNYGYYAQNLISIMNFWVFYDNCNIDRLELYLNKMMNVKVVDIGLD